MSGGAIATLGATRVAYAMVGDEGPEAGCGILAIYFAESYEPEVTAGEMHVGSFNKYLNNLWKDYYTLEEFVLLGDPSLQVGGYQ